MTKCLPSNYKTKLIEFLKKCNINNSTGKTTVEIFSLIRSSNSWCNKKISMNVKCDAEFTLTYSVKSRLGVTENLNNSLTQMLVGLMPLPKKCLITSTSIARRLKFNERQSNFISISHAVLSPARCGESCVLTFSRVALNKIWLTVRCCRLALPQIGLRC